VPRARCILAYRNLLDGFFVEFFERIIICQDEAREALERIA
jgi:hypothetical protein